MYVCMYVCMYICILTGKKRSIIIYYINGDNPVFWETFLTISVISDVKN